VAELLLLAKQDSCRLRDLTENYIKTTIDCSSTDRALVVESLDSLRLRKLVKYMRHEASYTYKASCISMILKCLAHLLRRKDAEKGCKARFELEIFLRYPGHYQDSRVPSPLRKQVCVMQGYWIFFATLRSLLAFSRLCILSNLQTVNFRLKLSLTFLAILYLEL
jgi:hypothetical protein